MCHSFVEIKWLLDDPSLVNDMTDNIRVLTCCISARMADPPGALDTRNGAELARADHQISSPKAFHKFQQRKQEGESFGHHYVA
jgi:hypothetical protein